MCCRGKRDGGKEFGARRTKEEGLKMSCGDNDKRKYKNRKL